MNVFGILWIVLELLAQPSYVDINGPRGDIARVFPNVLQYLLARYDSSAMMDHVAQQLQFLPGDAHLLAALHQLRAFKVDLNIAELEALQWNAIVLLNTAQQ